MEFYWDPRFQSISRYRTAWHELHIWWSTESARHDKDLPDMPSDVHTLRSSWWIWTYPYIELLTRTNLTTKYEPGIYMCRAAWPYISIYISPWDPSTGIHGFKASPGIELLDMNSIYGVNNLDQLKIKWISKNGDQQNPDIIGWLSTCTQSICSIHIMSQHVIMMTHHDTCLTSLWK